MDMRKSATFLILFISFALFFPFKVQSTNRSTGSGATILTTDHKFAPSTDSVAAVRQQIISSYKPAKPAANNSPVLLNRSAKIKRKPVQSLSISDNSFRKKLSARSAIIVDAKTGKEIY